MSCSMSLDSSKLLPFSFKTRDRMIRRVRNKLKRPGLRTSLLSMSWERFSRKTIGRSCEIHGLKTISLRVTVNLSLLCSACKNEALHFNDEHTHSLDESALYALNGGLPKLIAQSTRIS